MFRLIPCRTILPILASAVIVSCNLGGTKKPSTVPPETTLLVRVAPVERDTAAQPLIVPGKLDAAAEMKLSFKTGGVIRELHATEGAAVSRGQRIARLDTVEFAAWYGKARTALDKTSRDLARVRKLYADGAATLELLQNAESAVLAAQSDSTIAAFNLSQALLVAPSSGKIIKRLAESNEVIGPGMPVVLFASTEGAWTITASIADCDLRDIAYGDRAEVHFDALPHETFDASLIRIAGAAHPVTGTFEIELALDATHPVLRPGLCGEIRLFAQGRKNLAYVPATALVKAHGDTGTVYAVGANDSITPATVTIARLFGDRLAVSSGLENVNSVVAAGASYIPENTHIIIDRK